jgi:hypothetical protein
MNGAALIRQFFEKLKRQTDTVSNANASKNKFVKKANRTQRHKTHFHFFCNAANPTRKKMKECFLPLRNTKRQNSLRNGGFYMVKDTDNELLRKK